jgi:predicted helicase
MNDPNREDNPEYVVRLVGQVLTVSVETVRLVRELAGLVIEQA